ncbi:MAG TPA: sulfite exporter TauE/SafE family protein [Solirubrobacteraceae bacterium]|nr:sulfite exporter TauE/SafE family protein [Solirubrobacteraceae bacterium]
MSAAEAATTAPCWRLAVVGASAGLLSGLLGVGGGIIIVPGLIWAAGLGRHTATGTSLVAILPIAVVGTITYAVAPGGAFDASASAVVVAGSLAGAVIGVRVNARVSERALRVGLAVLSLVFGARLVVPLGFGPGVETLLLDAGTLALLVGLGLAGGVLAGLLGVGGSAIVIAVMVIVLGTSQVLAQGVALAAVIPTVVVAAVMHHGQGTLAPRIGAVVGAAGMLGAVPGAFAAFAVPAGTLRTVFGAFLIFAGARTVRAEWARR